MLNFHGRVTQASVKNFQLVVTENSGPSRDYFDRQGNNTRLMNKSASTHQLNQRYEDVNTIDTNDDDDNLSDEDSESDDSHKGNQNRFPTNKSMLSKNLSKSGYLPTDDPKTSKATDNNDLVSLQFGRVSNTQFSCDVSWPFSLMQAFAIALSSFDSKLACE